MAIQPGQKYPKELRLRVKGEGWRLVSLNVGPETEFKVSVGGDSGWHHINLFNYLQSNRWLLSEVDIINLYPDSLNFYVEKIISKKLPIVSAFNMEFKPGYDLASNIILQPDSVVVKGPASYLKARNEIRTSNKKLLALDSKTFVETELENVSGFEYSVRFN